MSSRRETNWHGFRESQADRFKRIATQQNVDRAQAADGARTAMGGRRLGGEMLLGRAAGVPLPNSAAGFWALQSTSTWYALHCWVSSG